jgi:hypothetical protein
MEMGGAFYEVLDLGSAAAVSPLPRRVTAILQRLHRKVHRDKIP